MTSKGPRARGGHLDGGAQGKSTGLLAVGFGQVEAGGFPLPGVSLDARATIDTGTEVYRLKVSPGTAFR